MESLYSKPLLHPLQIFTPKQNPLIVYTKRGFGNLKYNSLRLTFYYPKTDSQILSHLSECNLEQNSHFFKIYHESSWLRKRAISKPIISSELIKKAFILPEYTPKDTYTDIVSRALSELFQILKATKETLGHAIDSSATLFLADLCYRLKETHNLQNITQLISYLERVLQHPALFKGWSTTDTKLHDCIICTLGKLNNIRHILKINEQKDSAVDILKEIEHHLSQMILPGLLSGVITLTTQGTQSFLLTTYFEIKNNGISSDMNLSHFPEINTFINSEIGAYLSPLLEQTHPVLHGNKAFIPKDLSQNYHSIFSNQLSGLHPVFKQVKVDELRSEITQLIHHLNALLHFWKETTLLEITAHTLGSSKFYSILPDELAQFYMHFINLRERIKHSCEIIEHIGLIAQNHTTSWTTHAISRWSYYSVQQAKQFFQSALEALDQCLLQASSLLLKQKQHSVESSAIKERDLLEQLKATQSKASLLLGLNADTQKTLPSEKELKELIAMHSIQALSSSASTYNKPVFASRSVALSPQSANIIRLFKWCFKPFKLLWNLLKTLYDSILSLAISPQATVSEEADIPIIEAEKEPIIETTAPLTDCEKDSSSVNIAPIEAPVLETTYTIPSTQPKEYQKKIPEPSSEDQPNPVDPLRKFVLRPNSSLNLDCDAHLPQVNSTSRPAFCLDFDRHTAFAAGLVIHSSSQQTESEKQSILDGEDQRILSNKEIKDKNGGFEKSLGNTTELPLEALKSLALRFLEEFLTMESERGLPRKTQTHYYQQLASAQKEETIYCRLTGFINETKAHKSICDTQLEKAPYDTTLQPRLLEFETQQKEIRSKLLSESLKIGMYGVASFGSFFPNTHTENTPRSSFIHMTNSNACRCTR